MTDDLAPYSGAIEETAKTTGKALDLVRDGAHAVSSPIANIYGLLIGDRIDAARERNLDAITRKTKKILADRDLAETAPIPEQIAIPLLEAARGETRDEMQTLWAQLLANAMDPSRRDDVRPLFIWALEKFQPIDALILDAFSKHHPAETTPARLASELGVRSSIVEIAMDNLMLARCVVETTIGNYRISSFGIELQLACRP